MNSKSQFKEDQFNAFKEQNGSMAHQTYLWQSAQPNIPYNFNSMNDIFTGQNRRNSDVRSLIENLMKTKQQKSSKPSFSSVTSVIQPALVRTQQKIFQEIVNLLCQNKNIKEEIQNEKNLMIKLQSERDHYLNKKPKSFKFSSGHHTFPSSPTYQMNSKKANDYEFDSIINKLKSRGGEYDGQNETENLMKQDPQYVERLNKDNQYLQKSIDDLKNQGGISNRLAQTLNRQKDRFNSLKMKLAEKTRQINQDGDDNHITNEDNFAEQIIKLQRDIDRLRRNIEVSGSASQSSDLVNEAQYLNDQNQTLRKKTINIIGTKGSNSVSQQISMLEAQIEQENRNKQLFLEDLKKFKAQYKQIKQQNYRLKEQTRIKGGQGSWKSEYKKSGYEAIGYNRYRPKQSSNSNNERSDKLLEYNDLVSEMRSVLK